MSTATALIESARQAMSSGDTGAARSHLQAALEQDPQCRPALEGLAHLAMAGQDYATAASLLERLQAQHPDETRVTLNLAICRAQLGQPAEASRLLESVVRRAPGFLLARLHLAMYLEECGEHEEACRTYAAALKIAREQGVRADAPPQVYSLLDRGRKSIKQAQLDAYRNAVAALRERHGDAALERIDAAVDIYLKRREPDYAHPKQRPATMYIPGLVPRPFFEREEFPWLAELEAATDMVREEFLAAMQADADAFRPYVQLPPGHPQARAWAPVNNSASWSALHLYRHGHPIAANVARFPRTAALLDRLPLMRIRNHAPEIVMSVLQPKAHIPPHYGSVNGRLIVHLPLIVPPDCGGLAAAGELRGWEEGKCLVFDDSFVHEAWNDSDAVRVVVLLDIWNPQLTEVEREAFAAALASLDDFNVRVLGHAPMTFV